jgi:3-dehydroquinate dehydratase-1
MQHRDKVRKGINEGRPLTVGAISGSDGLTVTPGGCDLVELRLDSLGLGEGLCQYAENSPLPLLVTARGASEGGQRDWSTGERANAYRALLPFATLIDVELRDFDLLDDLIAEARETGVLVVGSFHDFERTPPIDELRARLDSRADLHKFALMAHSPSDIVKHLELLESLDGHPSAVMGMGPLGAAARPLMAQCGSLLNYGYLGESPTAPNQWPAGLLAETIAL